MHPSDAPANRATEALRRWRNARRAAVRRYGETSLADEAAAAAIKHFRKWLAKRGVPAAGRLR
jgi:hypothetical protein